MELNRAQLKAINNDKGPLLIVAGAGTGKTSVITEKIKLLIGRGLKPHEVLALTFTEKAAEEMVERLDVVMPLGYEEPWVSTFHKFGDRVLREEGLEIGLDPAYKVISQPQQWLLIKKHLFEFELEYYRPLGNPNKFISALLKVFSRTYDEDIAAKELLSFANSKLKKLTSKEEKEEANKLVEVAKALEKYEELKRKESVLDFGDLLSWTLRLFRERPNVLAKYKQQFKQVLVDEFQDTNYAQYELIKLLCPAGEKPKLSVVGDDSQSIYRFRGAAISNILRFMDDYPKAKQVILTDNYRSYQAILDGAYKLIKHNDPETLEAKLGISKNLRGVKSYELRVKKNRESKPLIIECESEADEVEFVVKKIYELLAKEDYTYRDFAILARANSQLEPYVAALKQQSLPYRRVGNRGLFDQEEIGVLINFLQVVANPEDPVALFKLLYYPGFKIKSSLVLRLVNEAKRRRVSLWSLVQEEDACLPLVNEVEKAQDRVATDPASRILFEFIQDAHFLRPLIEVENPENQLKLKNLNLFFRYLRNLEQAEDGLRVSGLVELLTDLVEGGENPSQAEVEDIDAITLSTAHSAKGLEFGVVFMVSLIAGRFPAYGRRDPIELPNGILKESLPEEDVTAEERRLFYVGMTRAADRLYLSWASDYGGVRKRKASGFLNETNFTSKKYVSGEQLSLLSVKPDEAPVIPMVEGKFEMKFTSFSQIDTYKACPLKFKYRYVLQIPAEPHHALSFGRSIHETLKEFHQFEKAGKDLKLKELLQMYERNFVDEGYESEEHKKERWTAGRVALEIYYGKYKSVFGVPTLLEQAFRINVAGVNLIGKIDRIDKTDEGYEIIDYKTGQLKDQKKVDRDEQLSIYALAAREALQIKADKLSLYFVEENQKVETERSEKQLQKKREELAKTIEEIKQSEFPAKPGYPYPCGFCEFKRICPYAAKAA